MATTPSGGKSKRVQVDEVLPPLSGPGASKASRVAAKVLDDLIRIPGTNFRIGLDPIIGLLPGGGDIMTAIGACILVGEAGKKGLPFRLIWKMAGNIALNAAAGAIPVAGDAFSVWFKSNSRNYLMLRRYLDTHGSDESKGSWWPLILILTVLLGLMALSFTVWITIWGTVFMFLFGGGK